MTSIDQLVYREVIEVRCETWWAPGVVLIGEAAHAIDPEAGVGAGLGFGDALALAVAIAGAADPDSACRDYEFWRRPAASPPTSRSGRRERIVRGGERPPEALASVPGLGWNSRRSSGTRSGQPGAEQCRSLGASQVVHHRVTATSPGEGHASTSCAIPGHRPKGTAHMARGRRLALILAAGAMALGSLAAAGCGSDDDSSATPPAAAPAACPATS